MADDLIESSATNSHLGKLSITQSEPSLVSDTVPDKLADMTSLEKNDLPVETPAQQQEWFNPLKPR